MIDLIEKKGIRELHVYPYVWMTQTANVDYVLRHRDYRLDRDCSIWKYHQMIHAKSGPSLEHCEKEYPADLMGVCAWWYTPRLAMNDFETLILRDEYHARVARVTQDQCQHYPDRQHQMLFPSNSTTHSQRPSHIYNFQLLGSVEKKSSRDCHQLCRQLWNLFN